MDIRIGIRTSIRVDICMGICAGIRAGWSHWQVAVVRHGLHLSLHSALVLVATVAMVITPAAATAMQESCIAEWGDIMAKCDRQSEGVYGQQRWHWRRH